MNEAYLCDWKLWDGANAVCFVLFLRTFMSPHQFTHAWRFIGRLSDMCCHVISACRVSDMIGPLQGLLFELFVWTCYFLFNCEVTHLMWLFYFLSWDCPTHPDVFHLCPTPPLGTLYLASVLSLLTVISAVCRPALTSCFCSVPSCLLMLQFFVFFWQFLIICLPTCQRDHLKAHLSTSNILRCTDLPSLWIWDF